MNEKNKIKKIKIFMTSFTKIDKEYNPIVITNAKDDILIDIDGKNT